MSLTFANVFKLMNNEYGTHSATEDGENVLENLRTEKGFVANKDSNNDGVCEENSNDEMDINDFNSSERLITSGQKRKYDDSCELDEGDIDFDIFMDLMERYSQNDIAVEDSVTDNAVAEDVTVTEVKLILNDLLDTVVREENKVKTTKKHTRISTVERMERDKKKHPMLDSCQPVSDGSRKGCIKKCTAVLTNNRRQEIHDHYWSLSK